MSDSSSTSLLITKTSSSSSSSSSSPESMADKTFKGLGSLLKLLPTGTVFVFQFLNPIVTNTGKCSPANKAITGILIGLCGFSCAVSCFTDSFKGADGKRNYGFATKKGLWTYAEAAGTEVDMSKYKLNVGDYVHALLAASVFAVISLLDGNTMRCFYPGFEETQKALVMVLPPVVGVVSGSIFAMFPSKRHGIGYPPAGDEANESKISP